MGQQQQQFEARDNSGALFKNDRRGENPNAPQAKGKLLVKGRWFWVSAWTKERAGGERFQSLAVDEMTDEQAAKYGGHRTGEVKAAAPPPTPSQRPATVPDRDGPFGEPAPEFDPEDVPF